MRFIIVGGGVAGITAAMDLARRENADVHVYSDEEYPYYYRPHLTEFLAGTMTMSKLMRRPLSWYTGRGIHVHLGQRVQKIHADSHQIVLPDGTLVEYDKLLLAMGSVPFIPPIKGADKKGVRTWRTLEDTLEMEKAAVTCQDIVVIGGGLLGLEAARGLKTFCSKVTVLEYFPRLLPRQLDVEGAALLQQFVEEMGVEVVTGARTSEFSGDKRVTGVSLADGQHFNAQTILVAAGVRPCTPLAIDAGIQVNKGVLVNHRMETNIPEIYAAGDLAEYEGYTWAIASIAQAQTRIAAANMAGEDKLYDVVTPSTALKIVGINVNSIGLVNPEADAGCREFRPEQQPEGQYKKIVTRDNTIVGAIAINDKILAKQLEQMISNRETVDPDKAMALLA